MSPKRATQVAQEKRRISAMFAGPKRCDCCRQSVPRANGSYVPVGNNRQQWRCTACGG